MHRFLIHALVAIFALCAFVSGQTAPSDVTAEPARTPLSYGIVVDNSGSFRTLLDRVIVVVSEVIENTEPDDEAFLVTFVDTPKIVLRQEFTEKKSELEDAAQNMFIEGGQTAILDALKSSADYLAENAKTDDNRKRAIVLITDGDERASGTKLPDLIKLLKDRNIRVVVIAISEEKIVTKVIDRLTKETGGKIIAPKNRADLASAAKEAAAAMRAK
jgi:Ca-activated chloride channel family protein